MKTMMRTDSVREAGPVSAESSGGVMNLPIRFTHSQLKIVAALFLTMGTIGSVFYIIPNPYLRTMHILEKVSDVLFLALLVQSARFTRNRKHLIIRLYLANLLSGVLIELLNLAKPPFWIWNINYNNYFSTGFYLVLSIAFMESSWQKERPFLKIGMLFLGAYAILYGYTIPIEWVLNQIPIPSLHNSDVLSILNTVLPSPLYGRGTVVFVLLGILDYYAPSRIRFAACITCLSAFLYAFRPVNMFNFWIFSPLIHDGYQYGMAWAVPLLLLLDNREDPRERLHPKRKYWYYFYAPASFILCILIRNILFPNL